MLLGLMLQCFSPGERETNESSEVIAEIIRYINTHYKEEITVKILAQQFSYSENYISKVFNAFTGMNLREYVNRQRIREVLKIKNYFYYNSVKFL